MIKRSRDQATTNFPAKGPIMTNFLRLMVPLAILCVGLGVLISGKVGQVLIVIGTVLAGVALVDVLVHPV